MLTVRLLCMKLLAALQIGLETTYIIAVCDVMSKHRSLMDEGANKHASCISAAQWCIAVLLQKVLKVL